MDEESFRAFLFEHLRRRPRMEVRDVYKLLYQGVFGVAHIMGEKAWERLIEEAERVAQMDHLDEPLVESVSVDGRLVRVNLRPYVRQGGDLRALYKAMLESSEHEGDPTEFASFWRMFKEAADMYADAAFLSHPKNQSSLYKEAGHLYSKAGEYESAAWAYGIAAETAATKDEKRKLEECVDTIKMLADM